MDESGTDGRGAGAPAQPRWLDAEEQDIWLTFARMRTRLGVALDAQMQRDAGLNNFEYLVLAGLSMTQGRTLRMSELAQFSDSSLSRLSNAVSRLEKRGWVTRSTDPDDARVTRVHLTDDGMAKVEASAPGHVEEVRTLVFDALTKTQQRQLRAICERVLRAVDERGTGRGC